MRLLEVKRKVIVVYGGGFQPFHQGHMSSYEQAKSAFPTADFYVAASNDVKQRPIPFDAKKFLAEQAGVTDPFVQVVQPVNPKEILQKYDPEVDVLVLVRSERDPVNYTKKDGSPAYYQPWTGDKDVASFAKHGYILVTKKHEFQAMGQTIYSGSQVRQMYAEADDAGRDQLIKDLYPHATNPEKIKQIFEQYLAPKLGEALDTDLLPMPKYTVVIDTPGDLDWYKIGQHFPYLELEDPKEFGQGDSDMTITLSNDKEVKDLVTKLTKLGIRSKVIGGTEQHPEIHSE
jgi:cytidyltransferase-like protein